METKHTRELLRYEPETMDTGNNGVKLHFASVYSANGERLIRMTASQELIARRLVACWNACIGMQTEDLESMHIASATFSTIQELTKQRESLVAALQKMRDAYASLLLSDYQTPGNMDPVSTDEDIIAADTAIAQALGQ